MAAVTGTIHDQRLEMLEMPEINFTVYKCFECERKCSLFANPPELVPDNIPCVDLGNPVFPKWVEYVQETRPEPTPGS